MPLSTMPSVILEHDNDLVDVVNGYVFTNLASSPPPQYVPGKIGNCVTKTLPGYVWHKNTDIPLLNNFAGDVTMYGWIKHNDTVPSYIQMAALNFINGSVFNLRCSYINQNSVMLQSFIKLEYITDSSTTTNPIATTTNIYNSVGIGSLWHFIAITRRASDNRIRMYFNDSNVTEWTQAGYAPLVKNGDINHDNGSSLCINSFRIQSQSNAQKLVDQVGIIPAELNSADIAYIYNNGNGRPYANF